MVLDRSGSRLHSGCCDTGRYQIFKDLVVNGKQEQKVPSPLYLFYIPTSDLFQHRTEHDVTMCSECIYW